MVTGASDGIGKEFAFQLAKAGFNVLLVARNQALLETTAAEIGARFILFYCYLFLTNCLKPKSIPTCGLGRTQSTFPSMTSRLTLA